MGQEWTYHAMDPMSSDTAWIIVDERELETISPGHRNKIGVLRSVWRQGVEYDSVIGRNVIHVMRDINAGFAVNQGTKGSGQKRCEHLYGLPSDRKTADERT